LDCWGLWKEEMQVQMKMDADRRKVDGLDDWFDLVVGKIRVSKARSKVDFSMHQFGRDWKYFLYLDYVALELVQTLQ